MKCLIFLFSFLMITQPLQAQSFGIAATVNDEAISEIDLEGRMRLILTSSGLRPTKANQDKVREQALASLIDETLRIQEAKKQNLSVTEADIDQGFERLAQQNKLTSEQFEQVLAQQGIPKSTLEYQIRSQISWVKVVQSVLRPQIDVTESDITAKMDVMIADEDALEYQVSEIFLPVTTPAQEETVRETAQNLVQELNFNGADFGELATQYSKSQSAGQNGALGWIEEGTLPPALDQIMKGLSEGQVSSPIRTTSGFVILTVTGKRTKGGEALPSEQDMLNQIGMGRLNKLQARYFEDLKAAAFIDKRF